MQNPKFLINHVLNEKAGVIEFDNNLYRKQICQIVKDIKSATQFNDVIDLPILEDYKFAKFSYNFSNIVSWLKTLNVYYAVAENEEFDAAVITDDIDNIFQKDSNGNIDVATIYIIDNYQENLTFILFHEMCHIYDYSKFKSIWMEDEKYFLGHKDDYDIENLIGKLRYIDSNKKRSYMNHYASEIKLAYYNFNQFDKIIYYIFKKLHKIIAHSRALFNYYFNLDSKAQEIFHLNESLKQVFIRGYTSSNRRFPSD